MGYFGLFLLPWLVWSILFLGTHQLQSSQTQVLLQLRKHLEYPSELEIWNDHSKDFCYLSSSTQVDMTCEDNSATELRIIGDKTAKVDKFVGFAIPNQTLSQNFSLDSLVTTLSRLNSLRVLVLVSLGIWGPLPDKIHRLSALEYLDLSSNYLFGSIPPKISTMVKLRTFILGDNFFNDTIPSWFDSLINLSILSLKNNRLKGPFPSSIQRITTLTSLELSGNEISGKLPRLSSLSSLHVLDLSGNKLNSDLPSMPKGLAMAFLGNNAFSGKILREYSQLSQLEYLDLSFNKLSGTPPAMLFSLPNITYLNLASNMLGGSLPNHLSCGIKLQFVDISNNRLTGGLPYCLSAESNKRTVKFAENCLSIDLHHQREESSCVNAPVDGKRSGGKAVAIVVAIVAGVLVSTLLLAVGLLVMRRICCPRGISEQHLLHKADSATGFSSELLTSARFVSEAAKLGTQGLPAHRSFTLEELKEATRNFDNSVILGECSHGKLYKGILENGTQVAIRCLSSSKKYTVRNLKLRLDLLSRLRHPHLVCLLGHCIDSGGQNDYRVTNVFLVYEYVPNGNFRAHLREDSPVKVLNWPERLQALLGIAKAVHFLHTGVIPGFFNNRLKTNNILLNEHGMAKLSDYGLSIISEDTEICAENDEGLTAQQMTRLDDDIYSFGFIVLESLIAPSVSARRNKLLLDELGNCYTPDGRARVVDPIVLATCSQESLSIVISITIKCISYESMSRPSSEDILWNLQYAAQIQATADGEQR